MSFAGWAGSGADPWHLDANTQSILFLTGESDQPTRIGFSIMAVGASSFAKRARGEPD